MRTSAFALVLLTVTAAAFAQTAKPAAESDAIAVLTREIRALRQEIAGTARASLTLQLLTARIQAQEQRIIYLDQQRAAAASRRSDAEQSRKEIVDEIQLLTDRELSKLTPTHRRDIQDEWLGSNNGWRHTTRSSGSFEPRRPTPPARSPRSKGDGRI
jgi:hypothetical protein